MYYSVLISWSNCFDFIKVYFAASKHLSFCIELQHTILTTKIILYFFNLRTQLVLGNLQVPQGETLLQGDGPIEGVPIQDSMHQNEH